MDKYIERIIDKIREKFGIAIFLIEILMCYKYNYCKLLLIHSERRGFMSVSYKRLWKLLIDRDMKKKDLAEKANISSYTMSKLNRGENITTDILVKICTTLDCTFDEIMELQEDK